MASFNHSERQQVFLFTDASFCQTTGAAGWACCIVSPTVIISHSGPLPRRIINTTDAERTAWVNGINFAAKQRLLPTAGGLLVGYTDHSGLAMGFERDLGRADLRGDIARFVTDLQSRHSFEIEMRHVRAHIPRALREVHHQLNARVDVLARKRMREIRVIRYREIEAQEHSIPAFSPSPAAEMTVY